MYNIQRVMLISGLCFLGSGTEHVGEVIRDLVRLGHGDVPDESVGDVDLAEELEHVRVDELRPLRMTSCDGEAIEMTTEA